MSQNNYRLFWCLLDGEEEAFVAEANVEWVVEQLVKAVQQEKEELRALDTSRIVLHKVGLLTIVDVVLITYLRS